jgi:hypothetical protein
MDDKFLSDNYSNMHVKITEFDSKRLLPEGILARRVLCKTTSLDVSVYMKVKASLLYFFINLLLIGPFLCCYEKSWANATVSIEQNLIYQQTELG